MQFLLLAFAVFWLIKIVVTARTRIAAEADRLLNAKHKEEEEAKAAAQAAAPAPAPAPAPSAEELELLREIRDLLKAQKGTAVKDELELQILQRINPPEVSNFQRVFHDGLKAGRSLIFPLCLG